MKILTVFSGSVKILDMNDRHLDPNTKLGDIEQRACLYGTTMKDWYFFSFYSSHNPFFCRNNSKKNQLRHKALTRLPSGKGAAKSSRRQSKSKGDSRTSGTVSESVKKMSVVRIYLPGGMTTVPFNPDKELGTVRVFFLRIFLTQNRSLSVFAPHVAASTKRWALPLMLTRDCLLTQKKLWEIWALWKSRLVWI